MERAQAIARLEGLEPALRTMGAERLYLFGSVARNQQTIDSDIDLFINIVPGHSFMLLDLAATQRFLTDQLTVPADLTTRDGLNPSLNDSILAEAIRIF